MFINYVDNRFAVRDFVLKYLSHILRANQESMIVMNVSRMSRYFELFRVKVMVLNYLQYMLIKNDESVT